MKAKATLREEIYCDECLIELFDCDKCGGTFIEGDIIVCTHSKEKDENGFIQIHKHTRCKVKNES